MTDPHNSLQVQLVKGEPPLRNQQEIDRDQGPEPTQPMSYQKLSHQPQAEID